MAPFETAQSKEKPAAPMLLSVENSNCMKPVLEMYWVVRSTELPESSAIIEESTHAVPRLEMAVQLEIVTKSNPSSVSKKVNLMAISPGLAIIHLHSTLSS
jgi:hypothetical protein